MSIIKRTLLLTALILALTLFVLPALAQDATPVPDTAVPTEVTQATAEPTAEPTEEATDTAGDEKPVVPANVAGTILLFLIGVLVLVLGGGSIATVAADIKKDKLLTRQSEIVGNSVPKEHADKLVGVIDAMVAVLSVGREALDHVAADSKPQQSGLSAYSIEQLMTEVNLRQTQSGASGFFTDVTPPIERFSIDELSAELRRRIPPTPSVDFNPTLVEG